MRISIISIVLLLSLNSSAQPVEMQLFVKNFTVSSTQLGVRMRAKVGAIPFLGATFYLLYQSANATATSFDDSRMVTGYGWGSGNRFGNAAQVLTTPISSGGRTFDRRYVYGNADESAGSFIVNLTTSWDTVLYVNFNNLQGTPPQGGYALAQKTADPGAAGVALTDPGFANIAIDVTSSVIALQSPILPVLLTNFDVQCQPNKSTNISWATSQEINNNYFEVEKSANGTTWSSLNKVTASGNSSVQKVYQVIDAQGGAAFYRLKQVDLDGKTTYSNTVKASCEGRNVFVTLYPVPARDLVTLVVGSDKSIKTALQVFDNKGRMVINMPVSITNGTNNFKVPVQKLAAGEYIIRSSDAGIEINKRFTVIR